jgi:hypothetical protein
LRRDGIDDVARGLCCSSGCQNSHCCQEYSEDAYNTVLHGGGSLCLTLVTQVQRSSVHLAG